MFRTAMLRLGTVKAVLCITLLAEIMAVGLDWVFLHFSPFPPETYKASLTMAVVLPLIVAPLIGSMIIVLLNQVEEARTVLEELAIHDGLTGLYNRTYFIDAFRQDLSKAIRYGSPLSLLMFDVDNFKQVNDEFGHSAGDVVLESIAITCRGLIREYDVLARYGGEEFVLLLPSTPMDGACQVAEKLRAALEEMEVHVGKAGSLVRITVSIGISSLRSPDHTIDALFARVDASLYESKRKGKNCWTCA